MRTLLQDLRYGVRMLWRSPGFTVVAVLALALGIGANTAIFSVVNAVLLRPLPFNEPERIVQIWEPNLTQGRTQGPVSPHNFADWQKQSSSFEAMSAYEYESFILTGGDRPERIGGALVSASFIEVIGVNPAMGRSFLPEEDQPGASRVAILSYGLWERRFGANTELIGQTLTLNNESFTVIGIMPPDFQFPSQGVDLWTPLVLNLKSKRSSHYLYAVARLKPTVALQQAQAEMDAIALQLGVEYPDTNRDSGVSLIPLHEQIVGKVRPALFVLLGAVALVLLIACANVANLSLARATARQKEVAIRTALGASRSRIVRQFLTESLLLASLGGVAGLLLALWGIDLLVAASAGAIPRAKGIGVDPAVLGFTLVVSLVTGVLFGSAPSLQSSKIDLNTSLKEGSKGVAGGLRSNRVRSLLVVSEIALALVLLIGAGLLIKSYVQLQGVDPGFDPANVLTMQLSLPESKYPEGHQRAIFFQRVVERIEALPGVQSAGAVNDLPFSGSRTTQSFDIEGRPTPSNEPRNADYRTISPHYFRAMGIRLLHGREFTERDAKDAPGVAIINETMARRFFAGENPLGQLLLMGTPEDYARTGRPIKHEIVGIVADIKHGSLEGEREPEMYLSYMQHPHSWMFLAVRSKTAPQALVAAVRSTVRTVDQDQPVYSVQTLEQRLANSIAPQRFNTLLLGIFAAVAMMLAGVGIYGVIAYSVTQRTHEIGIRIALGAQPRDVLKLVVGQGMLLTIIGIGIGLIGAFALTRILASLLYGVSTTDPLVFGGIALLLATVAMLASYIPARRATKVDPMVALRYE